MDDRIIDFNEIKNQAREKDVDKLENYMYSLYYEMAQGKLTIADFNKSIMQYIQDNNISQDKFFNIQKKLMSRYGIDMTNIEEQLKSAGVNISSVGNDFEEYRKNVSFDEKYNEKIANKGVKTYSIQNDKNNVNIVLEKENVILMSEKTIDLTEDGINPQDIEDYLNTVYERCGQIRCGCTYGCHQLGKRFLYLYP